VGDQTGNLLSSYVEPLRDVMDKATALGATAEQIHALELFGGGVRIPQVVAAIKALYPTLEVGKHIDGDEAAMLGAAYYANQLRGKKPDPLRPLVEVVEPESLYPSSSGHLGPLTDAQLAAIKQRLAESEAIAERKRQWDAAKNELEALVVQISSQLSSKTLLTAKGDSTLSNLLRKTREEILENYDTSSLAVSTLTARIKEIHDAVSQVKADVKQPAKKKQEEEEEDPAAARARNAEAKARRKREKEKHKKEQEKQAKAKGKLNKKDEL